MIPVKIIGAKIYSILLFQVNPEITNPNQQDPVQVHAHQFLFSKEKFVSNSMAAFDFTSEIENINQIDQGTVIQKLPAKNTNMDDKLDFNCGIQDAVPSTSAEVGL